MIASFLQLTLGNILTIIVLLGLGTGGYYRLKGIKNEELTQAADYWRSEAESLKQVVEEGRARSIELEKQRDEQRGLKHEAKTLLAAEKMKTDLTGIIKQLANSHDAVLARIELAEQNGIAIAGTSLERLEGRMEAKFDAFISNQELLRETMEGLLHGVADLNKKIGERHR